METSLLSAAPFNLRAEDIAWVRQVRQSMSTEEKLRQLFVLAQFEDNPEQAARLMAFRPGGVHRTWGADFDTAYETTRAVLTNSPVPPFVTGDLEGGGYSYPCMSPAPNPMAMAAAGDLALVESATRVLAREGRAMGFNWSFTPVLDINAQPESAIVGTRSYGRQPEVIGQQGILHIRALQDEGVAATAKHWPGEGFDARDQHLVTTVSPLSVQDWEQTFGVLYQQAIESGVLSVMSAHIAFPAWMQEVAGLEGPAAYTPASASYHLNTVLLRQRLGFNGVITSDATPMAGLTSWAERARYVPAVIAGGCDVFLFSEEPELDLRLMLEAVDRGELGLARIDEAVTRVLGLKAKLQLHRRTVEERLLPKAELLALLRSPAHMLAVDAVVERSVTKVKDLGVLPLNANQHRRVVVISTGIETNRLEEPARPFETLVARFADQGFEIRHYDPASPPSRSDTDLVLYLIGKESRMLHSKFLLDWRKMHGTNMLAMRRFWHEIPTVMVSFGHPYFLLDAPRVPCYVNAYTSSETAQRAVVERLVGDQPFTGVSPVDAFCGLPDARW